jgi:hypothetical protein
MLNGALTTLLTASDDAAACQSGTQPAHLYRSRTD